MVRVATVMEGTTHTLLMMGEQILAQDSITIASHQNFRKRLVVRALLKKNLTALHKTGFKMKNISLMKK